MLNLSDADLARLRLECWRSVTELTIKGLASDDRAKNEASVEILLAWCLRDRESPTE